ncbi:importin-11 isoform X2 [Folsomia candida]|uniref:importin-11 isoform X2 n=1 Tax=Folsomia candida TaxID=158441 RepID=UPI001604C27C|nr:importin-11 isoform X2 [Folsomia candida]
MDDINGIRMLYETLQGAASQNPESLKSSEATLLSWETQPGFYAALTNVISKHEFETNARFIAAIHLKNGIERHWKKVMNPPHSTSTLVGIPEAERVTIKSSMIQLILNEPALNVATQLALVTAKIARLEVREWPMLLPSLMASVQLEDPYQQHRALLVSYHVIKILSTKRLTGDRKIFQEIAVEIFDYLYGLWERLFLAWAVSGASGDDLPRAHMALKILRILCVRGYKVPHESQSVKTFILSVMQRAKETLELRLTRQDSSNLLEKHVVCMCKVVADVLEVHPLSFVPFLHAGLEFAAYFGFSEEGRSVVFERVAIHALNLMKGIILCAEFRAPRAIEGGRRGSFSIATPDTDPRTFEAADIKDQFFTNESLSVLVRVLVTRYLPLSQTEIESWAEDPEEFALRMDESGETWKYNLRQSAETLLVTLFKEFRKSTAVLLALMKEYETPLKDPQDRSTILAKDALYNAVGITAYELYDEFSFDTWLASTLVHELTLPVPILHRRITWLVGQWTGVKITAEARPTIYALLLSGLQSPDVVVRLSSSQALRSCLDDFDFVPEQFAPCMTDTFHNLFMLLKDVKESDNKMRVLHTMSFLIERMGIQIKNSNQIGSLAQYLPLLWDMEHNMLKAAVALGSESSVLREFLFPVIRIATDLKSQEHVYLLEDGLDLWLALMEYAPEPPDESFLSLVDNLIPLLSISSEHLKMSVSLVNSYAIIYPEYFTEKYGSIICTELSSSISDMRAEGVATVLRCMETFLRTSPINGPTAIRPIIGKIFQASYEALDVPFLLALFLSVVARLLLISEGMFQVGLDLVATSEGKPSAEVLATILDTMSSKVPYIVQPERKKLICISLLKLMSTCQPVIMHRICGIFLGVSETLNDILKADLQSGKMIDSLCVLDFEGQRDTDEVVTENDLRKKRLASRDVVYTVDLINLFRNEVNNLRGRLGDSVFNEVMQTVDVETLQMAKTFLE